MIQTIAFDLGGVIVDNKESDLEKVIFELLGINKTAFSKLSSDLKPKTTTGEITLYEFYEQIVQRLGDYSISPKTLLESHLRIHDQVLKSRNKEIENLILDLSHSYRVVSLTNTEIETMHVTRRDGLYDLFHRNYISVEMGMKKPEKEIYIEMLKDLNVKGDEVVFIDDKKENINTGNELGIISILYKDPGQLKSELNFNQ